MLLHPKKVWHKNDKQEWHQRTMEAVDANHAVDVDPAHWAFEKPVAEEAPEVIAVEKSGDQT